MCHYAQQLLENKKGKSQGLIAANGLVILFKLDSNHRFSGPCDSEFRWKTSNNNSTPLLCYVKFCASFHSHRWIQIEVIARKRTIRVNIGYFWSRVTLEFDGWPYETIAHVFYTTSHFVHHFLVISELKLELQSGNAQYGTKFEIWRMTLKNNSEPLICHIKLCASFHLNKCIQTAVMV